MRHSALSKSVPVILYFYGARIGKKIGDGLPFGRTLQAELQPQGVVLRKVGGSCGIRVAALGEH